MLNYNMPPSITSLDEPIYAGCSLIIQELICCRPPSDFFPVTYLPGLLRCRFCSHNVIVYYSCAVFSGGRTALLLTPGTREYASPPAANRRRDTDRGRRQLTRLPKPLPQYPPLTLRYGIVRTSPLRFGRCLRRSMALGSRSYL